MVPLHESENERLLREMTEDEDSKPTKLSRLFLENDLDSIDSSTFRRRKGRGLSLESKLSRADSFEDFTYTRNRPRGWSDDGTLQSKNKKARNVGYSILPPMFRAQNLGSFKAVEGRPESVWLIPVDHPAKFIWDFATVIVSLIGAYHSHTSIRDRSFGYSPIAIFCEAWFLVDIILNFLTQIRAGEVVYKDWKSVWARYLTTWFVIDIVSLIPWERHYVKPIVEIQKRRNIWKKSFFRTRAVVRVTARVVRGRHIQLFGKVAKTTKHAGVGARRLLRLLIKYLPKYIFFIRRMKGVVVMRLLRQVHHVRKLLKDCSTSADELVTKKSDDTLTTNSLTKGDESVSRYEEEDNGAYFR